jgi:predicted MFS family arabinose efflux permease
MKYLKLNKQIKLFIIVIFLFGLTSSAFNGFLGIYVKEIGYDEVVVGGLLSLRRFSVAGSAIIMALVASRFGRRNAIAFGLTLIAISTILMVSTKNIYFMQFMCVLSGISQSTLLTFEAPFLYSKTTEETRMHAFSASFSAKNAAFMVGSLATGLLADMIGTNFVESYLGVRYALYVISTMSLLALIPLFMIKGEKSNNLQKIYFREIKKVYSPKLLKMLVYTVIIGFGAGMIVPFFGVYLKYMLDLSDSGVGIILAIAQFGTVLGGLLVPAISKKLGRYNTVTMVQMGSIPFLILIGVPMNVVMVSVAFFFRSSLMNMANPVLQNLYMELADDTYRPLISSLRSTTNNLARALGILLGGFMMKSISYSSPYIVTVLCYFVGTMLFRHIFKKEEAEEKLMKKVIS